jgi:hypothetical protein
LSKKIVYILLISISLVIVLLTGCPWVNPFPSGSDLLAALDLSTDWIIDEGLILTPTADTPPAGETEVYFLSFVNLVSYDTFESSAGPGDLGTWLQSIDDGSLQEPPTICTVQSDGQMSGAKYLHMRLERGDGSEFIYHTFPALEDKNYIFRFNYKKISGGDIQVSVGENTDDATFVSIFNPDPDADTAQFDFFSSTTSATRQIRFGFADIYTNLGTNFEAYVDNIALFLRSNHNISKNLNLIDSSIQDQSDDGTGQVFYEGIYEMTIFAKKGTSNILTLRLGNSYREYTLTDEWVEYTLEAQILNDYDYLTMEVMPTTVIESQRFPGGINICRPHLYYYPNKSDPEN